MRQLHNAILSRRYLAKEDWAATIFPLNYSTIHRRLFHKFVSKIAIHTAIHANAYTMYATILLCKNANYVPIN